MVLKLALLMGNQFHYSLISLFLSFLICDIRSQRMEAWKLFCSSLNMLWLLCSTMVVLSLAISAGWSTIKVCFCLKLLSESFHYREVCPYRLKMHWNTTNSLKQPRKCHGNWNATHLCSFERSYICHFFAEMGKNGSLTLCSGLIFRWINVTKQTQ